MEVTEYKLDEAFDYREVLLDKNLLNDAKRFAMGLVKEETPEGEAVLEMFALILDLEKNGWEMIEVALDHSHLVERRRFRRLCIPKIN